MRLARLLLALTCFCAATHAQTIPTATGRQFTLSDAGWKVFIPSTYVPRAGNVADMIVHFHGDPQTYYNNAAYAKLNAIIVTVNYNGLSAAYETPFSDSTLFQTVMNEALAKVRAQGDIPDTLAIDKLTVSSFSAGYGAVRQILKSATYRNDIDNLLAADSLYATTASDGTPLDSQLADYKTFAALAKAGSKTFLFSNSKVATPGYESTGECGDEIMSAIGVSPVTTNLPAAFGDLSFYRRGDAGNFHLLGANGATGDDHLAHLRYIGTYLQRLPIATVPEPLGAVALLPLTAMLITRRRHRA